MNKHGIGPFKRIQNAFMYSLAGLTECFRSEQAFRQELYLCLFLCPVPFLFDLSGLEKAFMIFCLFFLLVSELANSAIEAVADRASPEKQELIRKAKDIGSAMVFLSLVATAISWTLILLDRAP